MREEVIGIVYNFFSSLLKIFRKELAPGLFRLTGCYGFIGPYPSAVLDKN
jgi:hypothetical protein